MPHRRRLPSAADGAPPALSDGGGLIPVIEEPIPAIYRPIRPAVIGVVAAALLATYAWAVRPAPAPEGLRLHALAVGNGMAVLVRGPGGRNLLYDCGSLSRSRPGEALIVPALRAMGIRRLDALVLSHANLDHYNGVVDVAQAMTVGQVYVPRQFLAAADAGGLPGKLLGDLRQLDVPVGVLAGGDRIPGLGPITADVLWPPSSANADAGTKTNDASLVVRISFGGKKILLTGDIERTPQSALMTGWPDAIRADVLVLPHHGNETTLDPAFVEAVAPQVAIASTGDPARLPDSTNAAQTSTNTQTIAVNMYMVDTHTHGMITVDLLPQGVQTETWLASP